MEDTSRHELLKTDRTLCRASRHSSGNTISSKIPFCQRPVGLSNFSMFGRASHRQPGVGSPQPQEVPRPAWDAALIQMELVRTKG